jgi:uncharacterized protein
VKLVDANVLIYAVNEDAHHHQAAKSWLDATLNGPDAVGLAWLALLAFVRITTNPRVFADPLEASVALGIVDTWASHPNTAILHPGPRHLVSLLSLLRNAGTAGNLVNDAHLAAIALDHDATVVTFDADFGRFAGVEWLTPGR